MAVQSWQKFGRPGKRGSVAHDLAHHGDTVGAMSVGAASAFSDPFRNFLFPVHRVHSAYCYRCPVGKTRAMCSIDCVDKLPRLLAEKHGEIAAVIVAPLLQVPTSMMDPPRASLHPFRTLS